MSFLDSGPELYMLPNQRSFRGVTSLPSILRLLSLYFRMEINSALGGLFLRSLVWGRRDCISDPPRFSLLVLQPHLFSTVKILSRKVGPPGESFHAALTCSGHVRKERLSNILESGV